MSFGIEVEERFSEGVLRWETLEILEEWEAEKLRCIMDQGLEGVTIRF